MNFLHLKKWRQRYVVEKILQDLKNKRQWTSRHFIFINLWITHFFGFYFHLFFSSHFSSLFFSHYSSFLPISTDSKVDWSVASSNLIKIALILRLHEFSAILFYFILFCFLLWLFQEFVSKFILILFLERWSTLFYFLSILVFLL